MSSEMKVIHWLQHYLTLLPWIGLILLLVASVIFIAKSVLRILNLRHLLGQKVTYLELTPPAFMDKTPQATHELYSVLHRLLSKQLWLDKQLKRESVFALEIMATLELGIRFLVRVPDKYAATFTENIHGYMRDVQVRKIESYLSGNLDKNALVVRFKQKAHWGNALKDHQGLEQTDPMSYVTTAMTKLSPGEVIVLQILLSPTTVPEAEVMRDKLLRNEDISSHLTKKSIPVGSTILHGINTILFGLVDAISDIHQGRPSYSYSAANQDSYQKHLVATGVRPARMLSTFEQEHLDSIHQKVNQPLFRTDIRALVVTDSKKNSNRRLQSIESAMASYTVKGYQALDSKKARLPWYRSYLQFLFMNRLPAVRHKQSNLLSVSEIASLYHFPHSITAKTENVVKSLSKTLPAPISLKDGTKLDVLLGQNHHHGTTTPIGLTEAERERHIYIIGGTGNGKTTMLQYGIVQDINNGKGIAVVDPHGDMATTLLRHIPESRMDDVIYLNPVDIGYPIGLNILELPPGLSKNDLALEQDRVTEAVVSIFRKIFSEDDSGGHRIEYILRNAVHTAFNVPDATLFTVLKLLRNATYRKTVTDKLKDVDLKDFWKEEIGKAGAMQRIKLSLGVTSKLDRFSRSAPAKRMLEQVHSTIDFDDILNSGKILICNFSQGLLGEDVSTLFGTLTLAKMKIAAQRRAEQREIERRPFYLYVDEFQNFATMPFVQMLSGARKYKLFLIMAEQSTAQQDYQQLVEIILNNVGTFICFRSGSPADERYVLPLFKRYLEEGDIANLPAYNFYARIAAVEPQEPMSGKTVLLDSEGSDEVADQVIANSRDNYATKYVEKPDEEEPNADTKTTAANPTHNKPTTKPDNLKTVKRRGK